MFKNCYRPGCHYDMDRCNCGRREHKCNCWNNNKGYDNYNDSNCCFPIEIRFQNNNFNNYDYDDECYDYYYQKDDRDNYDYDNQNKNYGRDYDNQYDYEDRKNNKKDDKCDDRNNWDKNDKCDHDKNNKTCNNRPNNNRNCRCPICFLAGCLFGCCRK